jgi:hypothetical protein
MRCWYGSNERSHAKHGSASVYAILGQLGSHLDADDCMPISTAGIAKTFIWSDVITFTIQSGGAGLEPNPKVHILVVIGSKVRPA